MGRGQGGLARAFPQWAVSAKPTQLAPVPRHEAKGFVAFGLDLRNPKG